ncbi:MAG: hypothetical protein V7644_1074 [Actinomycetota bacterium]
MERVTFGILGSLAAERGGLALQLGPPGQRAFLALLLVHLNRVVPRERLVDELWPDEPPATAVKALQVFASRLRKELGDEAGILVTRGQGYVLELEPDRLDAARFGGLLSAGRAALDDGRYAEAAARLAEALSLWRGPALADFGDRRFGQEEAARLEELRLLALEARIEAELDLGRHSEAVAELEALVREHPLREHLYVVLMRALYRCGRQADALEWYRDARRVLRDEVGIEPGPELQSLHRAVLNQEPSLEPPPPVRSVPSNLPEPPSRLIGRSAELESLRALLGREDVRLVTLSGPGGTGKTRLALEVARVMLDRHADGVFFVDLAPVVEAEGAVSSLVGTLEVEPRAGDPFEAVCAHLEGRRVLLLLDNLEQLSEAPRIVARLLSRTRAVRVLATSRAPLRISGEHEFPLEPLALPDAGASAGTAASSEAVALFVERARAVVPAFRLDEANAATIVEICRRLDGLPLALELAAARLRLLPPAALLRRLDRSLALLAPGARDLPERQQTLRATIDWSYALLDPAEQALFRRLGVFAGGWTLEAADAICATDGEDVLPLLGSLVDKSLIRQRASELGEPRFTMLETLREYARERLQAAGEAPSLDREHARYFSRMLGEFASRLDGPAHVEGVRALRADFENARASVIWALESGDAELALSLANGMAGFAVVGVYVPEARAWLATALEQSEGSLTLRSLALFAIGWLAYTAGELGEAMRAAEESVALARAAHDAAAATRGLNLLSNVHVGAGELDRAQAACEEALEIARMLGDEKWVALAATNSGNIALNRGDLGLAEKLFAEFLAAARRRQDRRSVAGGLTNLALLHATAGLTREAEAENHEALTLFREVDSSPGSVYGLEITAALASTRDAELAAQLLGAAGAACGRIRFRLEPFEQRLHDRTVADLRARLGDKRFTTLFAQGQQLGLEQAVDTALAYLAAHGADPAAAARPVGS